MDRKGTREEKITALLDKAEKGIKAVFESEKYKNFLNTMAKFHNYSFRNSILINLQRPDATYVAGYNSWKKNFNRHVKKGEKGIQILGYAPKKITTEVEIKDRAGNIVYDENGKPKKEKQTREIPGFVPVYVFDRTQTDGEPLPELVSELDGTVDKYEDMKNALISVSPYPVYFEDITDGAKGYCDYTAQKIAIKKDMSQLQTIKTLIHEITHSDLHSKESELPIGEKTSRSTREVEAESTAYVVASHYGMDTSEYSFGYIATWSEDKELKELQGSLEKIQKQANDLIGKIDTRLEDLQKDKVQENKPNKNKTKIKLKDRMAQAQEKAEKVNGERENKVTKKDPGLAL